MKKISLFTPCFNEEENIKNMYNAVTNIMATLPQYNYEYIFIDNCSKDKTPEILKEIAKNDDHVKVIFNVMNFGPGRSGTYGFMQTSGDASICLACDFQDPPEMIPEFIRKWEEGYKVAWGMKKDSDEGRLMFAVRSFITK
ncbi:MAG: glycosyltransferase family 2 protein [Desulfosporosinus sp.]|nr:glycosyltransferase family 2 protein [Desulfosporosinus sp.]